MTDVVQKLWGFCHTLRHDGIDYGDYIEQITYLLFLKMSDERGMDLTALPMKSVEGRAVKRDCSWPTLTGKSGTDLTYALNQWSALCVYTTRGNLAIDNDDSERALKTNAPQSGCKDRLFIRTDPDKSRDFRSVAGDSVVRSACSRRNFMSDIRKRELPHLQLSG